MPMFHPRRRRVKLHLADSLTGPRHGRTLRQGDVRVNHANRASQNVTVRHIVAPFSLARAADREPAGACHNRFGLLVEAEWAARENRRLGRAMQPSSTSRRRESQWHDYRADALADAICDRLLHDAHRLVLEGPRSSSGHLRVHDGRHAHFRTLADTGLQPGEALALQWEDDEVGRSLNIERAGSDREVKATKSEARRAVDPTTTDR